MGVLDDSVYTNNLLQTIKSKFSLEDYEVDFLKELIMELKKPSPSTRVGIENRVTLMDEYRVKLINLIFTISDRMSDTEYKYKEKYNLQFTKLVRAGRPSTLAIECEINQDQYMHSQEQLFNNFENFKSLLFGYLKTIDYCRDTCLKKIV